jgi:hypothetical protein
MRNVFVLSAAMVEFNPVAGRSCLLGEVGSWCSDNLTFYCFRRIFSVCEIEPDGVTMEKRILLTVGDEDDAVLFILRWGGSNRYGEMNFIGPMTEAEANIEARLNHLLKS